MKSAINDTVEYVKLLAQNLAGCKPNYAVLAIITGCPKEEVYKIIKSIYV